MNAAQEQYGIDRMIDEVGGGRLDGSAQEILSAIVAAAQRHAGSAPQYDDMTVVVVKRVR